MTRTRKLTDKRTNRVLMKISLLRAPYPVSGDIFDAVTFFMSGCSVSMTCDAVFCTIRKEKSNLTGSIFPGCTTAGLVIFASAAVCTVFTCVQQFNANCLSRSIQTDFIPLHFSLWISFTRKNKSGQLLFSLSIHISFIYFQSL